MPTLDLGQNMVLEVEQSPGSDSPYPGMFVRQVVEGQGKVVARRLGAPTFFCSDHLVIANELFKLCFAFGRQSTQDPVYLRDGESARRTGQLERFRNVVGESVPATWAPKSNGASALTVCQRGRSSRPTGLKVRRAHSTNDPANPPGWLGRVVKKLSK